MTAGEDALVGQLARLLEAEREHLSTRRMLELLSLLLGERALVGDASRYVYEYGRRAGYSLPAYPLDGSGEFREFFAEEGVRNVPEWYERKLGVPPQLYAQLPARTIVAAGRAAGRCHGVPAGRARARGPPSGRRAVRVAAVLGDADGRPSASRP